MDSLQALEEILKEALPKFEEPVLFRNMLRNSDGSYQWKLLKWSFLEFVEKFGDKKLPFRIGDHNKRTCALQHLNWRVSPPAEPIPMTLQEFVDKVQKLTKTDNNICNKWYYCDYKHMKDLSDKSEIIESFDWLKFGIDKELGKNGLHSTIWIGSKGAHTDCHRDTYGYNLVAQIHGRKQWLLYPPGDSLISVRLPYEESTVYSRFNIYCLSEEEKDILLDIPDKPKLIILEPGDVLFVPNGWWHYVESLDHINVSVNIWGKLKTDGRARVEEALVKLVVAKIGDYKQFGNKKTTTYDYTSNVESAIEEYEKEEKQETKKEMEPLSEVPLKRFKPTVWTAKDLAEEYPNYVKLLHDAEESEFKEFIEERRKRDEEKFPLKETTISGDHVPNPQFDSFLESLINALCHPDVISKAAEVLLDRHY